MDGIPEILFIPRPNPAPFVSLPPSARQNSEPSPFQETETHLVVHGIGTTNDLFRQLFEFHSERLVQAVIYRIPASRPPPSRPSCYPVRSLFSTMIHVAVFMNCRTDARDRRHHAEKRPSISLSAWAKLGSRPPERLCSRTTSPIMTSVPKVIRRNAEKKTAR